MKTNTDALKIGMPKEETHGRMVALITNYQSAFYSPYYNLWPFTIYVENRYTIRQGFATLTRVYGGSDLDTAKQQILLVSRQSLSEI